VVSGGLGSTATGSGPQLLSPQGIAVEARGTLVVVDSSLPAVVRVDPVTGNRTVVSRGLGSISTGSGPDLDGPLSIAVGTTGALYVVLADKFFGIRAVVRVDPTSGNRTLVSGNIGSPGANTMGSGPPFSIPQGLAVEAGGTLVVVDKLLQAVVRVNPDTGNRNVISGCSAVSCTNLTGSGPRLVFPGGIAVEAGGTLVVVESFLATVVRVDPGTGNRTIVSDASTGRGPRLFAPQGIVVESKGTLVVVDSSLRAVVRVHPVSGDRTLLSR
jgi:sugar lactone lactonase YvrE